MPPSWVVAAARVAALFNQPGDSCARLYLCAAICRICQKEHEKRDELLKEQERKQQVCWAPEALKEEKEKLREYDDRICRFRIDTVVSRHGVY